jgi:predicted ATPase
MKLFGAVDAFADLAEALALAGPLVIGLDDLQWADSASLLTLSAVVRRMAGRRQRCSPPP